MGNQDVIGQAIHDWEREFTGAIHDERWDRVGRLIIAATQLELTTLAEAKGVLRVLSGAPVKLYLTGVLEHAQNLVEARYHDLYSQASIEERAVIDQTVIFSFV